MSDKLREQLKKYSEQKTQHKILLKDNFLKDILSKSKKYTNLGLALAKNEKFINAILSFKDRVGEYIDANTLIEEHKIQVLIDGHHFFRTTHTDTLTFTNLTKDLTDITVTLDTIDPNKERNLNTELLPKDVLENLFQNDKERHVNYALHYLINILVGDEFYKITKKRINNQNKKDKILNVIFQDDVDFWKNHLNFKSPKMLETANKLYSGDHRKKDKEFLYPSLLAMIMSGISLAFLSFTRGEFIDTNYNKNKKDMGYAWLDLLLTFYTKYVNKKNKKIFVNPLNALPEKELLLGEDEWNFEALDDEFFSFIVENNFKNLIEIINALPGSIGLEGLARSKNRYKQIKFKYHFVFFRIKNDLSKFKTTTKRNIDLYKSYSSKTHIRYLENNLVLLENGKCMLNSYNKKIDPIDLNYYNNFFIKLDRTINNSYNNSYTAESILGNQKVHIKKTYDKKHLYYDMNEKQVDALLQAHLLGNMKPKENFFTCLIINDEDIIPAFKTAINKASYDPNKIFICSNDQKEKLSRNIVNTLNPYIFYPKNNIWRHVPDIILVMFPLLRRKGFNWGIFNNNYRTGLKKMIVEKKKEYLKNQSRKKIVNIHDSYNSDKHLEILEELFENADLLAQKSIDKIE